MKTIRIIFPLALILWIIGASVIAFGNAETFGVSWLMQSAGSIISGWLLVLIFSQKYFDQVKLRTFLRLLILLVVFCFYLVLPAGAITGWIANLAGIGDFISRMDSIKNLGFPLLFYILFVDTVNSVLAALICIGLIFFVLRALKLKASEPVK